MKIYSVLVEVTLKQLGRFVVEADSEDDAMEKVQGMLDTGEIDIGELDSDGEEDIVEWNAIGASEVEA